MPRPDAPTARAATLTATSPAIRMALPVALAVLGSLLLTISAKITVQMWPVNANLQTLAVFLIVAAYGRNLGVATVAFYLAQGAAGLPVFTGTPEKGIGLAYMVGPTGGYLLGFLAAAVIVGWAADRGFGRSVIRMAGAMLVAEVVLLALGAVWLSVLFGAEKGIAFGIGPFIVTDLLKLAIAAALAPLVVRLVQRLRGL